MPDLDPRLVRLIRTNSYAGLRLLLLFGSRARGLAADAADWDLAYLASPPFDPGDLQADLVHALKNRTGRTGAGGSPRTGGA